MLVRSQKSHLKNQKGTAMIEVVPLIAIFVLLLNFALGFFGVIHSGVLQSIAARNYAFETFRNRSNLAYLRDVSASEFGFTYTKTGMRYHGIIKENVREQAWVVTERPIQFTEVTELRDYKGAQEHDRLKNIQERQLASDAGIDEGVSPAWVRILYGICLNATCGGGS